MAMIKSSFKIYTNHFYFVLADKQTHDFEKKSLENYIGSVAIPVTHYVTCTYKVKTHVRINMHC